MVNKNNLNYYLNDFSYTNLIQNKITNNSLGEIAYKEMKSLIINNKIKPGQKIIQEKMATLLGISRIPVIEALTVLEHERLVEKIPRKGFYVRTFSKTELSNIMEVRMFFEMIGASHLAKDLTEEKKEKLLNFLKDFEYYRKNNLKNKYRKLDIEFHYFLIYSTGNDTIININENLNILLIGYIKGWLLDLNISFKQHKELIDAIINGNVEKAESFAKNHILTIKETILSV